NSTDPSEPTLTFSLSDKPDFPADVTVTGMTVTGSSVAGLGAGSYDDATGVLTIVPAGSAISLGAGDSQTFDIAVTATIPVTDTYDQATCADGYDGPNLWNDATAHSGESDYT